MCDVSVCSQHMLEGMVCSIGVRSQHVMNGSDLVLSILSCSPCIELDVVYHQRGAQKTNNRLAFFGAIVILFERYNSVVIGQLACGPMDWCPNIWQKYCTYDHRASRALVLGKMARGHSKARLLTSWSW